MTAQELADLAFSTFHTLLPPPKWTVSQWADKRRRLSGEASAEKGQWRTSRAEYQREILDSISNPDIHETVVMSSAQVGKSEILLNALGYFIDFDPSPILLVQPTLELAEAFSKDRITPMLRDSPSLKGKVGEARSRDSKNTTLHKGFDGGHVTLVGANSPTSGRSRPVRVVMFDEVSAMQTTPEGDPVKLIEKRTTTFWNRRDLKTSTPGIKGFCRIEKAFERSDKRYFYIPCPRCQMPHVLRWGNVLWPEGQPEQAVFKCPHCEGTFTNAEKNIAIAACRPDATGAKPLGIDGKPLGWRASAKSDKVAGFHLWEAYSPWSSLTKIVKEFLESKDDPSLLQVWVNTCLGETWEEAGEAVSDHELLSRCEKWPDGAEVPERGLLLTAGVDTQTDRLEVEVVAWAGGEESWSVDYRVIHGDPDIPEGAAGSPWNDLTDYLRKSWKHQSGGSCIIESTCIDSGGSNTQAVYQYVKRHKGDRVFAIKGKGGDGIPIVGNPARRRSGKKTQRPVDVYIVGVDQAKSIVYKRLKIGAPGPGYCHFPLSRSTDYFRQLTAEKMVTRFVKGFAKREWVKQSGARNEALDCRVYAFAALILRAPQFDKVAYRLKQRAAMAQQPIAQPKLADAKEDKPPQDPAPPAGNSGQKPKRARTRVRFLTKW